MDERNFTSFHLQRCNIASSEAHNMRLFDVSNSREDLRHNNVNVVQRDIKECNRENKQIWESVHKRRMSERFSSIKEGVLVTNKNTTPSDVEKFCELCYKAFGIVAIQYHMHNDEGHYDMHTNEWKPNYHVHIVFDFLCKEHKTEYRLDKKKNQLKETDLYGYILQLRRSGYRKLQDLAAEATGMQRGIPGRGPHLSGLQYTYKKTKENLEECKAELKSISNNLDLSLVSLLGVYSQKRKSLINNFETALKSLPETQYPVERQCLNELRQMSEITRENYTEGAMDTRFEDLGRIQDIWSKFSESLDKSYTDKISSLKNEADRYEKEVNSYKYLPEQLGLSPRVRKLEFTVSDLTQKIKVKDSKIETLEKDNDSLRRKTIQLQNNLIDISLEKDLLIQKKDKRGDELENRILSIAQLIQSVCPQETIDKLRENGIERIIGEQNWNLVKSLAPTLQDNRETLRI